MRNESQPHSYVTFEDCFEIDDQTLIPLTYKPQSLRLLELGHPFYTTSIGRFDTIIHSLENACQLKVLDLTDCPLSDLSFLNKLHNLESLNLTSTKMYNDQLKNIEPLFKLTYLYLSLTKVQMSSILKMLRKLNLEYLDACGIICSYDEFTSVISLCPTLRGFQLSFCSVLEYKDASGFIEKQHAGKVKLNTC